MSENNPGKSAAPSHPSPARPTLKDAGQARATEREARRAAALRANLTRRKAQTRARDAGEAPEAAALTPGSHGADPGAGLGAGRGPDPKA